MSRPGPVLLVIGALSCGAIIGWTGAAMRAQAGSAPGSKSSSATAASIAPGKLNSAQSATGPKFSGVLDDDASSSRRKISGASPEFARTVRNALAIQGKLDREIRLREVMREIPVEDLPAACENARNFTRSDSSAVLSTLGARWAEADPHAAAEFALKFGNTGPESGFNSLLLGVLDKWSRAAPAEAATWAEALPAGKTRTDALTMVIYKAARENPEQALELLRRQPLSSASSDYAGYLFTPWAEHDVDAAAAAAVQLHGDMAERALRVVAQRMGQEDPTKAMAWAASVPNLSARNELIRTVANQWAEADPQAEIRWARGVSDAAMRRDGITKGIAALAGTDASAALEQIHTMPAGDDRDTAVRAAALQIAGKDARSGLQLLSELPAGSSRNDSTERICNIWGQSEPRAALDWFMENAGSSAISDTALSGYKGGITQIIHEWTANSSEDAISWAKTLPTGDHRDAAMTAIVNELTTTDLDRAQALFADLSSGAQKSAAYPLTNALCLQDANKAQSFALSLPPGPAQNNALNTVASQMADRDPVSAAQWLGTLVPGKGLDSAISGFAMATVDRDPEAALAWAVTIGDQRNREKQTETLVSLWMASDSAAACAWLDANQQVTPEEKRRILHGD
jgi:hypothetical protein